MAYYVKPDGAGSAPKRKKDILCLMEVLIPKGTDIEEYFTADRDPYDRHEPHAEEAYRIRYE